MEGKRATYKYLYKISIEEIELLLKKQNNNCAICGVSFLIKKSAVDHCHTTGKVRGMLCRPCNSAIGLLGENTRTLNAAIRYLKK